MKFFEEKSTTSGKLETREAAPPPPPKPTSGNAWLDAVYGTASSRPKLYDRADAVAVHDLTPPS